MIILAVVAAFLAAYLVIGFVYVAPRYVTREVESDIRRYPGLADRPGKIEEWRRFAAGSSIAVALVWPFYLAGRWIIERIASAAPPSSYELKIQSERQAKRIAELERLLGIGKS